MQSEEPIPSRSQAAPRLRRWLVRLALGATALVVVLVAAAALLLHQLDAPWLKSRIVAAVRSASGVELDYRAVRVRVLSGVAIEGLVVRTPPALRALEPDLARIGRIEVAWSLSSLLGHGPPLDRVSLHDVAVTLVTDEHGNSSLDLGPGRPPPAAAPAPSRLSRLPGELLSSAPPAGRLELTALTATVARAADGRVVDRFTVRGLALQGWAEPAGGRAWRLRLGAGAPSSPLAVDVTRSGEAARAADARLGVALAAELTPASAAASLDLRVRSQTFAPGVVVDELLHVQVGATFDAARGRTELAISSLRAGDGAAGLDGTVSLDDAPGATPLLRSARGDLDLVKLLRLAPDGLVPATLARGEVHWRAEELALGPPLATGAGVGSLALDAALDDLRVTLPHGELAAGSARLTARAAPGPEGQATLRADGLRLVAGGRRLELGAVEARLEGARAGDGTLSGRARVELPSVRATGAGSLSARQGWLELRAAALRLVPGAPLATTGLVELTGELASLEAQTPAGRVAAEGARWSARVPLAGKPPFAAQVELPVERLVVAAAGSRPVVDAPARIELRASGVIPELERLLESRGIAELSLAVGPIQASLHATKERDAVDLDLHASASELASLRRASGAAEAWERMRIDVASRSRVERLSSPAPRLEQHTTARLGGPAWASVSAEEATLDLRSSGDALQHRADLEVRLRALRAAGTPTADQHVTIGALLDRRRSSAELRLLADGEAKGALTAVLALDPRRGAVRCDLDGSLEQVPALARLGLAVAGRAGNQEAFSGLALGKLSVTVHGEVLGVVAAGPGGAPRVAPAPLRTAAPSGTVELQADGLAWRTRDRSVAVPSGRWRATFRSEGVRRSVESDLELAELHVETGDRRLDAAGLSHHLTATLTGEPSTGELDVEQRLELASLRQDLVPYAVEGARLGLRARRDRDGAVHLSDLRLENPAAGTTFAAQGLLDLSGFQPRLSLEGHLEQDLARASTAPGIFTGSGRVLVDVSVESPDLATFRTASALRFEGVHARLPERGIAIEGLDGEVPVTADVVVRAGRTVLVRQSGVNPYPALRFADQHPLLTRASFLTATRLETPSFSAAPLAGNVKVEQNLVSVSQLEMGVRSGSVTGACVLDWNGRRTKLEARVRATGVLSSQGEPFDGNAAVIVSAADRSLDGRAEILRIGRRHLLDLLDVQDPHRSDAAINRVRRALALGYPDRVRIGFDQGFARVRVTFGGVAGLIRLEELRGIPMGPLVEKMLAPFSRGEAQP